MMHGLSKVRRAGLTSRESCRHPERSEGSPHFLASHL